MSTSNSVHNTIVNSGFSLFNPFSHQLSMIEPERPHQPRRKQPYRKPGELIGNMVERLQREGHPQHAIHAFLGNLQSQLEYESSLVYAGAGSSFDWGAAEAKKTRLEAELEAIRKARNRVFPTKPTQIEMMNSALRAQMPTTFHGRELNEDELDYVSEMPQFILRQPEMLQK